MTSRRCCTRWPAPHDVFVWLWLSRPFSAYSSWPAPPWMTACGRAGQDGAPLGQPCWWSSRRWRGWPATTLFGGSGDMRRSCNGSWRLTRIASAPYDCWSPVQRRLRHGRRMTVERPEACTSWSATIPGQAGCSRCLPAMRRSKLLPRLHDDAHRQAWNHLGWRPNETRYQSRCQSTRARSAARLVANSSSAVGQRQSRATLGYRSRVNRCNTHATGMLNAIVTTNKPAVLPV